MDKKQYNFPVYATQGGGLVRYIGNTAIFVEAPNCQELGLKVGDTMPTEWGIIPANDLARRENADANYDVCWN